MHDCIQLCYAHWELIGMVVVLVWVWFVSLLLVVLSWLVSFLLDSSLWFEVSA